MKTMIPNIAFDAGSARDYIDMVDTNIRRIKNKHKSVKIFLNWSLSSVMV